MIFINALGNALGTTINASGLAPNQPHAQLIHALRNKRLASPSSLGGAIRFSQTYDLLK